MTEPSRTTSRHPMVNCILAGKYKVTDESRYPAFIVNKYNNHIMLEQQCLTFYRQDDYAAKINISSSCMHVHVLRRHHEH
eukprot:CAMPEP_0178667846 /NCGR_PEP_ID=MMETSP0698-20121128/31266_1 /TAXON_ID=265572 /ORGANISM="Extubocellulus spinifer, Strain CCMP396" /LENGTH=79 /DNA_ID=CAMNT_0020311377 /DNA_START=622 /DNA_END=861 /DNA_ORIENTATION=+